MMYDPKDVEEVREKLNRLINSEELPESALLFDPYEEAMLRIETDKIKSRKLDD